MELNEEEIYKKWKPILEKFGMTEDKTRMLSKYAEIHSKVFESTITASPFSDVYIPILYSNYTASEIKEGNKLIASFMNINSDKIPEYHKDWAALMNTVLEIEKGNYGIKQCRKVVEIYFDDTKEIIIKEKRTNRIESLWNALVNFIKWKNENNK